MKAKKVFGGSFILVVLALSGVMGGCAVDATGEEQDEIAVEDPGLGEQYEDSSGNLRCWHSESPPHDLHCKLYGGYCDTQWSYSSPMGSSGGFYTSCDEVNWGMCLDPGGSPPSFWIDISAKYYQSSPYTFSLPMGCK